MKITIPKPVVICDASNLNEIQDEGGWEEQASLLRPPPQNNVIPIDDEIRRLFIDDCISEGYLVGAVVVHVRTVVSHRTIPTSWGVVITHNTGASPFSTKWKPLQIKWLNGTYEDCEPKDLRIMLGAVSIDILRKRAVSREL